MCRKIRRLKYYLKEESELTAICKEWGPKIDQFPIWLLYGSLGAGKTTFVRYMSEYLNISDTVCSPTFTLINIYSGDRTVVHADLYRLNSHDDFYALDFDRYCDQNHILFIEWPEKLPKGYFKSFVEVNFEIKGTKRELTINPNENHQQIK